MEADDGVENWLQLFNGSIYVGRKFQMESYQNGHMVLRVSASVSHNPWSLILVPHIIKHFFYFVHTTSLRPQTVACEASWPTKPLPGAVVIY